MTTEVNEIISMVSANYRVQLSEQQISIFVILCGEYGKQAVKRAVWEHLKDPDEGRFFPTMAHLIKKIDGQSLSVDFKPTPDAIIAAAREPKTPLGVLARIKIGSWDLDNQDNPFYLRQRAEEVIQALPEWTQRAKQGEYTNHELECMAKFDVNPLDAFAPGLPKPNSPQLEQRAALPPPETKPPQIAARNYDESLDIDPTVTEEKAKKAVVELSVSKKQPNYIGEIEQKRC